MLPRPFHTPVPSPARERSRSSRWWLLLTVAAALLTAASPGCEPPLTSEDVLAAGPFAAGFRDLVLHDEDRDRSLRVLLWYPAAAGPSYPNPAAVGLPVDPTDAPYPLVVYSHGFSSFADEGNYLTSHLATHGYVVIAPEFPFTNFFAPGGPDITDVVNQPGDVSFLIDTLLAWSETPGNDFASAVDGDRIGLTGLSLGGLTTYLSAYHRDLRDPRIKVAAPIAGPADFFGRRFFRSARVPLLAIYSDLDAIVDFEANAPAVLANARPPLRFVTFFGAAHTGWSGIAAILFENLPNADAIGCVLLGGSLPQDPDDGSFFELLGGAEAGLVPSTARPPCSWGAQALPAIRPSRQHRLTILAVRPFLDLHLSGADVRRALRAGHFLNHTLQAENGDELAVAFPRRRGPQPQRWGRHGAIGR